MRVHPQPHAFWQILCWLMLIVGKVSVAFATDQPINQADQVERLFHTATQRRAIDNEPRFKVRAATDQRSPARSTNKPTPSVSSSSTRKQVVTGFLRRSDGINTVFVDHKASPATAKERPDLLLPSQVGRQIERKTEQPSQAPQRPTPVSQSTHISAGKP